MIAIVVILLTKTFEASKSFSFIVNISKMHYPTRTIYVAITLINDHPIEIKKVMKRRVIFSVIFPLKKGQISRKLYQGTMKKREGSESEIFRKPNFVIVKPKA